MSGFKTGAYRSSFLPIASPSPTKGRAIPSLPAPRRDEWKAQGREGTDPQKEKSVPEACGRRQPKPRSRMEDPGR
jgi:hypothetical protein